MCVESGKPQLRAGCDCLGKCHCLGAGCHPEREQSELSVESGRGNHGFNHGFTCIHDNLYSDSDRWHDGLHEQRFGHRDGQSVAYSQRELASSVRGRFGNFQYIVLERRCP